ncbi:helix-turn-helix domain-containing protein [Mycobacterium yunnanensis]|uniref:Helix-turn-helix domain-containing protein n=1 Tax=Mycobacterium yunnanensis TaxID=368477 RepID=A0A9X2Z947_9MYCO|nr:helix-turn-helix domain-containing protein [Mycobacterium yunnanensis]MCV7424314.1 helix-turn-helix domain-containing protein [Mycobacterium yunnanensis]
MGIGDSRTPAVHRGARILDAVSSGAATTPAALMGLLGLPKSSIADLLTTLEDVGFLTRRPDGTLHTGSRLAELSDPESLVHRLFRACATPELDGHTLSLVRLFGDQILVVDVHPGTLPLPLTPRPGQRADAAECAGAAAILSALTVADAAESVATAAEHLGLTADAVARCLALRHRRQRKIYESRSSSVGRQLACAVPNTRYALTLHVPDRWPEPAIAKAARALSAAVRDY